MIGHNNEGCLNSQRRYKLYLTMEKSNPNISTAVLTNAEMATLLSVLAEEYKTTVPSILHKLDSVSGDLNGLHRLLTGDKSVAWSKEEDDLLSKNSDLLKQWKGTEVAEKRKKYLNYKGKWCSDDLRCWI